MQYHGARSEHGSIEMDGGRFKEAVFKGAKILAKEPACTSTSWTAVRQRLQLIWSEAMTERPLGLY
jgi:hypothetical protein